MQLVLQNTAHNDFVDKKRILQLIQQNKEPQINQ